MASSASFPMLDKRDCVITGEDMPVGRLVGAAVFHVGVRICAEFSAHINNLGVYLVH